MSERLRRQRHPNLRHAVHMDLTMARRRRGDMRFLPTPAHVGYEALRYMASSDAFAALVCYRIKAASQRRGIPVVPRIAQRLAIMLANISIGDDVVVEPGILIAHGQVVIDGVTEIGKGVRIGAFVEIGPNEDLGNGPTVCEGATIGSGAKVFGPITIGENAVVAANAVVVEDQGRRSGT